MDLNPCSANYIISYVCLIYTSPLADVAFHRVVGRTRSSQPAGQTKKAIQPGLM